MITITRDGDVVTLINVFSCEPQNWTRPTNLGSENTYKTFGTRRNRFHILGGGE